MMEDKTGELTQKLIDSGVDPNNPLADEKSLNAFLEREGVPTNVEIIERARPIIERSMKELADNPVMTKVFQNKSLRAALALATTRYSRENEMVLSLKNTMSLNTLARTIAPLAIAAYLVESENEPTRAN